MSGIDTQNVIKIAKHALRRSKGFPDKRLMHPRREWGSGLIMFIVVLVVGSLFTAHLFTQFRNIDTQSGDAGVTIPKYNAARIEAVLATYQVRKDAYDALVADRTLAATLVTETASSSENETTAEENNETDNSTEEIEEIDVVGEAL